MGFFDKYPYTDFHELNLDWLLKEMKELHDYVMNLELTSESFDERYIQTIPGVTPETFYVSTYGDDSFEGSYEKPVRTINQAIRLASRKHMDVRIKIIDDGVYPIDILTNCAHIHINSMSDNVTLSLERNFINYQCHLNIAGTSGHYINIEGNGHIFYVDNGITELNNVNMNADYRAYGGVVNFTDHTIVHQITLLNANCLLGRDVIVGDMVNSSRPAFSITNSKLYVNSEIDFQLSSDQLGEFMHVYGSEITWTFHPTTNGYKYAENNVNLSTLYSADGAMKILKSLAYINNFGDSIIYSYKKPTSYIFLSDSYGGYPSPSENWITNFVTKYNVTSYYKNPEGGCSFTGNYDPDITFIGQLQELDSQIDDKEDIDEIVVLGGLNDKGTSVSDIQTAIQAFITYAQATYPNASIKIGCVGWSRLSSYTELMTNVLKGYQTCVDGGAIYINGIENVLHNRNLIDSGDNIHPNSAGAAALSDALVQFFNTGNCDVVYPETDITITPSASVSNVTNTLKNIIDNNISVINGSLKFDYSATVHCNGTSFHNLGSQDGYFTGVANTRRYYVGPAYITNGGNTYIAEASIVFSNGNIYLQLIDDSATDYSGGSTISLPYINIVANTYYI